MQDTTKTLKPELILEKVISEFNLMIADEILISTKIKKKKFIYSLICLKILIDK